MTKLEALPFDHERWPALQAEGWRFAIFDEQQERRFVGYLSDGWVVYEGGHQCSLVRAVWAKVQSYLFEG